MAFLIPIPYEKGVASRFSARDNAGASWVPEGAWQRMVQVFKRLHDEGRLKLVNLSKSGVRNRHLADLAGLAKLQMLNLRDTEVSEEGVALLQAQLPECKIAR